MKKLTLLLLLLMSSVFAFTQTEIYHKTIKPFNADSAINVMFPLSDGSQAWLDDPYFIFAGPKPYQCYDNTMFYSLTWSALPPSRLNDNTVPFELWVTCMDTPLKTVLVASGTGKWTNGNRWAGIVYSYQSGSVTVTQN